MLRGMDTMHHWPIHSFTAALGTQLSCARYLKKSWNKIQFQNLYGSTAPTRCSVVLKNRSLLSFEQVASSVQTLRRAVRATSCVHHTS